MSRHENSGLGTFTAFVVGAVAGGVAALLMAPDKGTNTRRRIRTKAEELKDKSGHVLTETRETLAEKGVEYKGAAQEGVHRITDKAAATAGAVKSAVQEAKDTYRREAGNHKR